MGLRLLLSRSATGGDSDDSTCNRLASSCDLIDRTHCFAHDAHRSTDDVRRDFPGSKRVLHPFGESRERITRLARALRELRFEKVDVVEDLIDFVFRKRVKLSDESLSQNVVHVFSSLSPPTDARATSIDVHVRSSRVPARVNPETANKLGMLELDNFYRESNHSTVECRVFSVTVRIHDDVRRIAVLVFAVARGAGDMTVMRRRTKPGMHVEGQAQRCIRSIPSRDL